MAVCEAEAAISTPDTLELVQTEIPSNVAQTFSSRDRTDIMGIMVDRISRQGVFDEIERFVVERTPRQIVTVNVDFLNISEKDPRFIDLLNNAAISVPDGMPLLWVSRMLGTALPERITGTDLLLGSADLAAKRGYRIFLLGAAEGVAAEAARLLESRYPGLPAVGSYSPPYSATFDPHEDERMIRAVQEARPDMLFVALGTPKQEKWISNYLHELGVPVAVGVGGVFNFITGRVPRAPQVMQSMGMEWLFRLVCEPRRLWRRYLLEDSRALSRALLYTVSRRRRVADRPKAVSLNVPVVPLHVPSAAGSFVAESDWSLESAMAPTMSSRLQD